MATTNDRQFEYREGIEIELPVAAATKIPAGVMVCVNSNGYAVNAANTAGYRFVGVSMAAADNTNGANGAINVLVRTDGVFEFKATSISQANVGADMYVVDNETFDETNPGNGVKCGKLVKYVSSTKGWIKIGRAVATDYPGESKYIVITVPRFTGWVKDGTDKQVSAPQLELPVSYTVKRAYLALGTAPGSGKTVTIKVNNSTAVTCSESNTQAQNESLDIVINADTSLQITVAETSGGSGANADLMLVGQIG